ncbi:MAG: PKD domain-containing protein [Bacteroidetes bacterium]|nr:MAG: PKD domain-containing protein [Bacteroidota bacterium]
MKSLKFNYYSLNFLIMLALMLYACKDEGFEVPPASTQADFDYEINVIVVDEEEGIEHYEVQFINKSILAQSYFWDFGNNETSTEANPSVTYTQSGSYYVSLTVEPLNDVYYNKLTKSTSLTFGKIEILFEDFNEGIDFTDEDTWAPEGWKAIDNDGDGFNWYVGERQGVLSMRSQSWTSDTGPLEPDNWLITPEINLTQFSDEATITFRCNVGVTASTPMFRQEHYGVFIAVGSDNLENFVLLFEETFTEDTPNWVGLERNIDISEYAGQVVYLAIRHFNVTDMDRIIVEEVEIYAIE